MLESPHILGTIAGADTVFVVTSVRSSIDDIVDALTPVVPRRDWPGV